MADQPTTEPTTTPTPEPTATPETPQTPEPLGEGGKAALDAERRARRDADKQLRELQAKLQEYEDRDKTELEKALARAEKAERDAADAAAKALRADVAAEKGVPAALLSGGTREELEAAADALLAFRGEAPKAPPAPSATGQGKVGEPIGAAKQLTRDDLTRMAPHEIVAAKAAGKLDDLLGIKH